MARRPMREKEAIIISGVLGLVILLLASPLWAPMIWNTPEAKNPQSVSGGGLKETDKKKKEKPQKELPVVDETGVTLKTRINPPAGYKRIETEKDGFSEFVRNYKVKKSTGVVKYWDGRKKKDKDKNIVQAVFKLPLEKEDLQRSAGAVIRMYAEYFWAQGDYDKISFQLINGFQADFSKWKEGYRIRSGAAGSMWVNGGSKDDSEENFKKYLHTVLMYTSAASMKKESKKVKKQDIQIGDIFLQDGTSPEVAMVVDVCENTQGQKAFLLAKGGKPAQQFYLMKNPASENDPWYYVDGMTYPLKTADGDFAKGSLRRLPYLEDRQTTTP